MEKSSNFNFQEVQSLLDIKFEQYNRIDFIQDDPIQIPHHFTQQEDIEIIGFLIALIAWGKRSTIIKSGERLMQLMHSSPYEFITHYESRFLEDTHFVHRTFNMEDLDFICRGLQRCYQKYNSLSALFNLKKNQKGIKNRIINCRNFFLQEPHRKRSEKHLANPAKGSAAKRLNMFLRWMVRKDCTGVDFGLWDNIPASELCIPLDVHSGRIARQLGLLTRKQNDWKAVEELMENLRKMDPLDPCKYDFSLFGLGVSGELE